MIDLKLLQKDFDSVSAALMRKNVDIATINALKERKSMDACEVKVPFCKISPCMGVSANFIMSLGSRSSSISSKVTSKGVF